jgi:hypothetical protein
MSSCIKLLLIVVCNIESDSVNTKRTEFLVDFKTEKNHQQYKSSNYDKLIKDLIYPLPKNYFFSGQYNTCIEFQKSISSDMLNLYLDSRGLFITSI